MKHRAAISVATVLYALCFAPRIDAADGDRKIVKVFILAGQSNMEGYLGSAKTLCAIGKACAEALGYR